MDDQIHQEIAETRQHIAEMRQHIVKIHQQLTQMQAKMNGWRSAPLKSIHHEIGYAYSARTGHPELSSHKHPSPAYVFEDRVPLPGPGNALHDDIRHLGGGRYSFWHDFVYFSTSDNSDPHTNGRHYEVSYLPTAGSFVARIFYMMLSRLDIHALVRWGRRRMAFRFVQLPKTSPNPFWTMLYWSLFAWVLFRGRDKAK